MIAANDTVLWAKTEKFRSARWRFVGWRAVRVLAVLDAGALGTFAEIQDGTCDRYGRPVSVTVDARELLSLGWLESLSATLVCVPAPSRRVASAA